MSAGAPRMWTGRSAFVLGVIFRRTSAGSRVSESSTSARTGTSRVATTAFALAVRRQEHRVVVGAEAGDPVTEHEELDARSSRRSGQYDHDLAAHLFEAPVAVRARAGVAEGPAAARPPARKADGSVVGLPW